MCEPTRLTRLKPALIALVMLAMSGLTASYGKTRPAAHSGWRQLNGVKFKKALPRSFYLEGNAIPIERYHAVLLQNAQGKQVLIGLLATSGYSSGIRQKYIGMIIAEAPVRIGSIHLGVGSYGFGLAKLPANGRHALVFRAYNQAGQAQGAAPVSWDTAMRHPTPLRIRIAGAKVFIYLGRHEVVLH